MKNLFKKSPLVAICLFASTSVFAVPVVDGFMSTGEYGNSFEAGWYNGHNQGGSQYQKTGNHATSVYWENTTNNFFLYIEAPIEAKNMIWGTGFNDDEALTAYQHWCSPNDGNTAAIDGSNCGHHKEGLLVFQTNKTDYRSMTGSEKVVFGDLNDKNKKVAGNLTQEASGSYYGNITQYMDSVDYVFANWGCNKVDCTASDTPMAFEFMFEHNFSENQINMLISDIQTSELEFHLSPERGAATAVPEPSSIAFLGLGLAAFGFLRKKKKT